MLKVLERDYKQHVTDVCHEFPNCKFVMRVDAFDRYVRLPIGDKYITGFCGRIW